MNNWKTKKEQTTDKKHNKNIPCIVRCIAHHRHTRQKTKTNEQNIIGKKASQNEHTYN